MNKYVYCAFCWCN